MTGELELRECLSSDGETSIHRALLGALRREVVVRVHLGDHPAEAAVRYEREAARAGSVHHVNVAQVLDVTTVRGRPAIVLEHLPGVSLRETLRRERYLSARRVRRIGEQLLSALRAVHRAGLVHRGLEPSHVLLVHIPGQGELVKLIGFGDAVEIGDRAEQLSDRWLSPEERRGRPSDGRSDVFRVGRLLTFALGSRSEEDAIRSFDSNLTGAIARALQPDRAHRWQSAEAMEAALAEGRTSAPPPDPALLIEVRPPREPARRLRKDRRSSVVLWVSLSALTGVVLAGLLGLVAIATFLAVERPQRRTAEAEASTTDRPASPPPAIAGAVGRERKGVEAELGSEAAVGPVEVLRPAAGPAQ